MRNLSTKSYSSNFAKGELSILVLQSQAPGVPDLTAILAQQLRGCCLYWSISAVAD